MKFIKSLLSENGNVSAMRFGLLVGVLCIFLMVLVCCYSAIYLKPDTYIDKLTYTIGVVGGIFIVGKVAQKKYENGLPKEETTIEKQFESKATEVQSS